MLFLVLKITFKKYLKVLKRTFFFTMLDKHFNLNFYLYTIYKTLNFSHQIKIKSINIKIHLLNYYTTQIVLNLT